MVRKGGCQKSDAIAKNIHSSLLGGFDVPDSESYGWITFRNPSHMASVWLAVDLGPREIAAMSLALEESGCILLIDDALARRTSQAAGLTVWGTLRILLEGKKKGLTALFGPRKIVCKLELTLL